MSKMSIRRRGFTLIELLVVISIIALLSSVVLASLNAARAKARDARRKADLVSIATALQAYFSDRGSYPHPHGNCASVNDDGSESYGLDKPAYGLVPSYIRVMPSDPLYGALARGGNYMYYGPDTSGLAKEHLCARLELGSGTITPPVTCGATVTYNYCIRL